MKTYYFAKPRYHSCMALRPCWLDLRCDWHHGNWDYVRSLFVELTKANQQARRNY